jgi:hypothetical protein
MTPAQIKEAMRLSDNYHKNRLIDQSRAYWYYQNAMADLLGGKHLYKRKEKVIDKVYLGDGVTVTALEVTYE